MKGISKAIIVVSITFILVILSISVSADKSYNMTYNSTQPSAPIVVDLGNGTTLTKYPNGTTKVSFAPNPHWEVISDGVNLINITSQVYDNKTKKWNYNNTRHMACLDFDRHTCHYGNEG